MGREQDGGEPLEQAAEMAARLARAAGQAEKAVKVLGGKIKDIIYFSLPDSEIQRSLVVIEKTAPCPGRYPRKAGTPQKEPIL